MGECIANGTAAGPVWTDWLLSGEMRLVRGTVDEQPDGGRWGVIDALPANVAASVAIKNGWTLHGDNTWNVNCLAIHDDWILAIISDYAGIGDAYALAVHESRLAGAPAAQLNGSCRADGQAYRGRLAAPRNFGEARAGGPRLRAV